MPSNALNTKLFIEKADIDYYTHFIKAWIPFNSWYKNKWPEIKTDREAINKIKDSSNTVRSTIINYIDGNDDIAKTFKSYLSSLHYELAHNTIENRNSRISFENVVVGKNITRVINREFRRIKYKLTRTDTRNEVTEMRIELFCSDGSIYTNPIIQTTYDLEELSIGSAFQNLTETQQNQIKIYYRELIPYSSISILINNPEEYADGRPKNYLPIGAFKFIESKEKIAQGLIEIIYLLRNVLFHGALDPNEANNKVYKNAYNILFMIIQKLR